jgi:hypothetical protein
MSVENSPVQTAVPPPPREVGAFSVEDAAAGRVQAAARRSLSEAVCDTMHGVVRSKILLAALLSAGAILFAGFLFATFIGWIASAVVVAALAAAYFYANQQKASFEIVTLGRLFSPVNFHEIKIPQANLPGKLYLGSLPNELGLDKMRKIMAEGPLAVLSVNEEWELKPRLASHPVSEKRWADLGVAHHWVEARDHYPLQLAEMDRAADWIHEQIQAGKNVFVHCRAGLGRSAMAIAAYLVKYTNLPIENICVGIKNSRKRSSIWDKVGVLRAYNARFAHRPPISSDIAFLADALDRMGPKPKIGNMAPEIRAACRRKVASLTASLLSN